MITPGILYRQLKQKYDVEIIHHDPPEVMISTLPKDQLIAITFFFPNGYGASIIRHGGSYGGDAGLFEIAVIKGDRTDWHLTYDTPVTNDVIGYLDLKELLEVVGQIHDLPGEVEQ